MTVDFQEQFFSSLRVSVNPKNQEKALKHMKPSFQNLILCTNMIKYLLTEYLTRFFSRIVLHDQDCFHF